MNHRSCEALCLLVTTWIEFQLFASGFSRERVIFDYLNSATIIEFITIFKYLSTIYIYAYYKHTIFTTFFQFFFYYFNYFDYLHAVKYSQSDKNPEEYFPQLSSSNPKSIFELKRRIEII